MVPAMATRPTAQLWVASTAGTEDAYYLKRKVEAGRAHVDAGTTHRLGVFRMVGAGRRRTSTTKRPGRRSCPRSGARSASRRYVTRTTTMTHRRVRPGVREPLDGDRRGDHSGAAAWLACRDEGAAPDGGLVLAVDVPPDRSSGVIVAAGEHGRARSSRSSNGGPAWHGYSIGSTNCAKAHDVRTIVVHAGGPGRDARPRPRAAVRIGRLPRDGRAT